MRKSFYLVLLSIIFFEMSSLYAQYSTAEYITSVLPPVMAGKTKVPDGNRTLELFYPYLIVGNQWFGIQIIDISNPLKPIVKSKIKIPGYARNAVIQRNYLYISDANGSLYIYDISNIESPKKVNQMRLKYDVQWVTSDSLYLYLAFGSDGFGIYDISDPENPAEISITKTKNFAWEVLKKDNHLFVSDNKGGLLIYDVSSPETPKMVATFDTPNMVRSVVVDNQFAYIADGPGGMWIVDISNITMPEKKAHVSTDGFTYGIYKSGQYIYLADEKKGLLIVNALNPAKPFVESNVVPESPAYDVLKQSIYLFLCTDKALLVYRHDNPPILTDVTDQVVDENQVLTIQLKATDPDNDPIVFSAENLPEGASLDTLSGYFEWRPTYDQAGVYPNVVFKVTEKTTTQLSSLDTITITVNNVNRPPSLPKITAATIKENQPYELTIPEGSDPDKEDQGKLTYSAENLPQGASFDPVSRKFVWKPNFEQSGTYLIDFLVKDMGGLIARQTFTLTVEHVDRPPVIEKVNPIVADENELITFKLKGYDPDKEDVNRVTYELGPLPEGATFDPGTQTFSWTPNYEQSGVYKMTAKIISGKYFDSTSVVVTVNHVNRPPVLAQIPDYSVKENELLQFTISGSDPDKEDKGKLTFSVKNLPKGAAFDPATATFKWKPNFEQSGIYPVVFIIQDPPGASDSQKVNITVIHVNRPPVLASIEPQVIDENQLLTFTLNGSDPDKEDKGKLRYSSLNLPEGASLDSIKGIFSWTPNYDQSGEYNVEFLVTDGQYADTQKVHITVNHVNRPPVLAEIKNQSIDENALLSFVINGEDPDKEDSGKLEFYAKNLPEGATFDADTRTFSWKPNYEQSGQYNIIFGIKDPSGLSDEKQVMIQVNHVNRPPVLLPIEPITVDENQPLEFALQGSDPDKEDKGKLSYFAEGLPEGATLEPQTGLFSWTPSFDQSGTYNITLGVTDQQLKTTIPLKIVVNHVNRPPFMEPIADQTVNENEILNVVVSVDDPDKEDKGKLKVSAFNLPEGAVFDDNTLTFSWKPTYDQAGSYTVTFEVKDPAGLTDRKEMNISVINVNRAPSIQVVERVEGKENEPITFTVSGSDPDKEDTGKLVFSASNLPEGATFDTGTLTFSWTPTFDQAGDYTVVFKVVDTGNLSAKKSTSIHVINVNRPPVLSEIPEINIKENQAFQYELQATDPDKEDINKLTFSLDGDIPDGLQLNGNQILWTPNFDQSGSYTFTVLVSDGELSDSKPMTINVEHVNRPPLLENIAPQLIKENQNWTLQLKASDPDKEDVGKLTFSANNLPSGCLFDPNTATFTWTPTYEQAGEYAITATVSDGQLSDTKEIKIKVENVNRKPVLETIESVQGKENEEIIVPLKYSDPDKEDQNRLQVTIKPEVKGLKFDKDTKSIKWKPDFDQAGTYTFTVTVSDGDLSSSQKFSLTIENVNRKPNLEVPSSLEGTVGEKISFTVKGSDPDKDEKLTFSASNLPEGANFDGEKGMFQWTPSPGQEGNYTISIKVMDEHKGEAEKTVKINVKPQQGIPADSLQN